MRVGICGLGLIGSSLARGLAGDAELLGYDPTPEAAAMARSIGVRTVADVGELAGCDLVALAAPTVQNARLLDRLISDGPHVAAMDLGSVKVPIQQVWLRDASFPFVGTHPMAGSELSGPQAGAADLFRGSAWPVVVAPQTDPGALHRVVTVVLRLGGRPVPMSAERHDDAVALASHLPHLLAGALGATVATSPVQRSALVLAAGSFRDVSRVTASPPERTAEFVTANALRASDAARAAARWLERAADLLTAGDDEGLTAWLDRGHAVRRRFVALHQAGEAVHRSAPDLRGVRDLLVAERDSGRVVVALSPTDTGFEVVLADPGPEHD